MYYSLYKTSQMNGLDFKYYLREVITTMMKHIDQIEFKKNEKGTIIGYRGHHIPNEVLESIAPWNLAKKFDSESGRRVYPRLPHHRTYGTVFGGSKQRNPHPIVG